MFSHLKKLDVKAEALTPYTVYVIEGAPVLMLAPATEANTAFFNSVLRRTKEAARRIRSGVVNKETLAANREEDRENYPLYIIKGWSGVTDEDGNNVPFSVDACKEFVAALPDWIFDDIRTFAGNPANFVNITGSLDSDETGNG